METAAFLRVSPETVKYLRSQRRFAPAIKIGRRVLWLRSDSRTQCRRESRLWAHWRGEGPGSLSYQVPRRSHARTAGTTAPPGLYLASWPLEEHRGPAFSQRDHPDCLPSPLAFLVEGVDCGRGAGCVGGRLEGWGALGSGTPSLSCPGRFASAVHEHVQDLSNCPFSPNGLW